MAGPDASKPAAGEREPRNGVDSQALNELGGIQQVIEHLKKGEWAAMAGAILGLLTRHFGSPEEKAEAATAATQGNLDALRSSVKARSTERKAEDAEKQKPIESNPELYDGRSYVLIGDSAADGMHQSYPPGKKPAFIGKVGFTTFEVLGALERERAKLSGKKKAIIYCAGNNILGTSTEQIVDHMVKMAKICSDAKVPEIIVNTQFPPIPKHINAYPYYGNRDKFKELKDRNEALRLALLDAYKKGRFPAEARVVDLTTAFADTNSEMRDGFWDPNEKDTLHPWKAYKPALAYMGAQGEPTKAV